MCVFRGNGYVSVCMGMCVIVHVCVQRIQSNGDTEQTMSRWEEESEIYRRHRHRHTHRRTHKQRHTHTHTHTHTHMHIHTNTMFT